MDHLNRLAEVTSRCGVVNRGLFVTNALRRLSVASCKGMRMCSVQGFNLWLESPAWPWYALVPGLVP